MVFDPPAEKAGRSTSHLPDPPESTRILESMDPEESKEEEEHELNQDSRESFKDDDNVEDHDAHKKDDTHEEGDYAKEHDAKVDDAHVKEDKQLHDRSEQAPSDEKPFSMALDNAHDSDEQHDKSHDNERDKYDDDNERVGYSTDGDHDPDDERHFSTVLDDGSVEKVPPDEPVDDDTVDEIVERFPSVYCAPGYDGDEEDPPEAPRSEGPPSTTRVYLNVYDLSITNTLCCHWIGCGQYHTGVVVFGTEHHFNPVGVEDYTPRNVINARWRTSVDRGTFTGTPGDVYAIIKDLKKEYRRNRYNMIFRNANHFSEDFLERLNGSELPSWLNRVSNCATSSCKCCIPTSVKKNVKAKDWIKHDPHKVQGIYGSNFIAR